MSADPPRLRVTAIELYERPIHLRLPFRFGVVTLRECPQAFARIQVRLGDGRSAWGGAAELMAPKWFDKNLSLTNEDNFEQLRQSLRAAREAYLSQAQPDSAFGHFAKHYQPLIEAGARHGRNALISCYGPALLDRALLDALCRALGCSFYDFMQSNGAGLDARLTSDLQGFDFGAWFGSLRPAPRIALRHTVGLLDPIDGSDVHQRVGDGLPETLEEVVAATGCHWFKLKVSGQIDADLARLARIGEVLGRVPALRVTLDGNEQFETAQAAVELWQRVQTMPELRLLTHATQYIEQPLARARALEHSVNPLAAMRPVLIDESDDTLEAFPRALALGYTGVSSKQCKGVYRSLLNAARCHRRNALQGAGTCFMSAEDLTTQAGLAVQQDLALVNLIGLVHVERNGHHYVDGFFGQGASPDEATAFLRSHPDLYEAAPGGNARLRVQEGHLDLRSLRGPGFAASAMPQWSRLEPLGNPG